MKKLIFNPASPARNTAAGLVYVPASSKEDLPPLVLKGCIILMLLFVLSTQCASAQKVNTSVSNPPQTKYEYYMQKHKTNNTIAWLLLVPGVTMATIGVTVGVDNVKNVFTSGYDSHKGEAVAYTGGLMALVSIPLFISANGNKRKALLSLKKEKLSIGERGPGKFTYPAIAIKIKF